MREQSPWLVLTIAVLFAAFASAQESLRESGAPTGNGPVPVAAEPAPDNVDLRLRIAAGTMNHRLLVYEVCSPRGCTYESHLQWFKTEWDPETGNADEMPERTILATCPIAELTGEAEIVKAHWRTGSGADPKLSVVVTPPTRDPQDYELLISPGKPCEYTPARIDAGGE
jgi:hypothetical protein